MVVALMFGAILSPYAFNLRYLLLKTLLLAHEARMACDLALCHAINRLRFSQQLVAVNAQIAYLRIKISYLFFKRFIVHKFRWARAATADGKDLN